MSANKPLMLKLAGLVLSGILLSACNSQYHIARANRVQYRMDAAQAVDSGIIKDYEPFKRQLDAQMNAVIGRSAQPLTKSYEAPETLLGNFFSDAVLQQAGKLTDSIDMAMTTTKGGLRNDLPAGDIRLSAVFELMPFENELVLLRLRGSDVQSLLNFIAKAGGEPVSGLRMTISGGQPANVMIHGQPFDPGRTYRVLVSDYIAGGGDNTLGLGNPLDKRTLGLKIRDALISYIKEQTAEGKEINAKLDGRITKN